MNMLTFIVAIMALPREIWSICPTESSIASNDGYRYTRIDIPAPASVANLDCIVNYGGRLVMIKTDEVSETVDKIIIGCDDYFYIGLEYKEEYKEEDWYWVDGTALESGQSRWADGYGENGTDICACVVPSNRTWIHDVCSSVTKSYPYICETNALSIDFPPGDNYALVHDDVTFTFTLTSSEGPAKVEMFKEPDDSTILDSQVNVTTGPVNLKLESVNAADSGTYVIVATAVGIMTSDSTVLFVEEPASIISEVLVEVSSPITDGPGSVACEANGIPAPTVRWTNNGHDVTDDSNIPGVYQNIIDATAILNIENAISSDDGTYTCIATNQVGRDDVDQTDEVETRLRVFGSPTIIDIVVIGCADNTLLVQMSWKANNQTLGINHTIEGTCYGESTEQCFLVTLQAQSDVYIETSTYVSTKPFLIDIKITVCPDDCIVNLADNKTIFVSPIPVTNASVTVMDDGPTESYCEVRWNSTQPAHAEQSILFKVKETSTPVSERASSNISPLIQVVEVDPITDGYFYKTKAEPNSDITFEISVATDCTGDSEAVRAQGQCITDVAAPYEVVQPSGASADSVPNNAHGVVVYVPDERNGPISCLFVIVRRGAKISDTVGLETLQTFSENAVNKLSPEKGDEYIASCKSMSTIYDQESITVVLGTGEPSSCDVQQITKQTSTRYDGYNWALTANESYSVSIVTTTPNEADAILLSQSESYTFIHSVQPIGETPNVLLIVLLVIALLLLVAATGFILCFIFTTKSMASKEPNDHTYANGDDGEYGTGENSGAVVTAASAYSTYGDENSPADNSSPTAISLDRLLETFKTFSESEGKKFNAEFQDLKERSALIDESTVVASNTQVKKKNRFRNVLPYDHCRVCLVGGQDFATYINASYINGYKRQKKFIATQGPLPSTVDDFWKMVIQQKSRVIVLVTNLVENGKKKCECYWPESSISRKYGDVTVTGVSEENFGGIAKRVFDLSDRFSTHRVVQYQLMNWPDHGVPISTSTFFRFHKMCMEAQGSNDEPIIVHCSAGAGRTGTFIAYDYLIHEAMESKYVDPSECVLAMRKQRMDMVQTCDQYKFIYRLVTEYHLFNTTDLGKKSFYADRSANNPSNAEISRQMKNLQDAASLPKIASEKVAFALNVPVTWRPEDGENIARISAVRVETHDHSLELIACIPPSKSTAETFWRLNLDNDIQFIVSINDPSLHPKENVNECWPSEEKMKREFFSVSVELSMNVDGNKNFHTNTIHVRRDTSFQSKEIKQYNILKWRPKTAVNVIEDIKRSIRMMSPSKPLRILVHCRRGFGETGAFCALVNLLSRLETEKRVDVFRTVKDLKDANVGLVSDQKQYKFCYEALRMLDRTKGQNNSIQDGLPQDNSAYMNEQPLTTTTL